MAITKDISKFTQLNKTFTFIGELWKKTNDIITKQEAVIDQKVATDDDTVLEKGSATSSTPTINSMSGTITTAALATGAGATTDITLTNSRIKADSIVHATLGVYEDAGQPRVMKAAVTAGQAVITIVNDHATDALDAAVQIRFSVH